MFWKYIRWIFALPVSALASVWLGRILMFIVNHVLSSTFDARDEYDRPTLIKLNEIPYIGEFILFSIQICVFVYILYVMIPLQNEVKKLRVALGIIILINSSRMFAPYILTGVMNWQFIAANILFSCAAVYFIVNPQILGIHETTSENEQKQTP